MNQGIVESSAGVTLVAGGPVSAADLALSLRHAPSIVAADGGADRVLRAGLLPSAVIGDFDSISEAAQLAIPSDRLHVISEQETTDFDKALRSIAAPFVIGLGCLAGRTDHALAVLNALVRQSGKVCVLMGGEDVVFHGPPEIVLQMQVGDRLSLFPLAPVQGRSTGLRWPIDGLAFTPGGVIGTSNQVNDRKVHLQFDAAGMIVIVARNRLDAVLTALQT